MQVVGQASLAEVVRTFFCEFGCCDVTQDQSSTEDRQIDEIYRHRDVTLWNNGLEMFREFVFIFTQFILMCVSKGIPIFTKSAHASS